MTTPHTKIIIAHTARSGSNWLSNILSHTGVCGFAEWLHCHYWVGQGDLLAQHFEKNDREYWEKMTTPNGVAGCKCGWGYLTRHISHHCGAEHVARWMEGIDHWIHLRRLNKVQQAISMFIAQNTGIYTSIEEEKRGQGGVPKYNYYKIDKLVTEFTGEDNRWVRWFEDTRTPVYTIFYEDLVRDTETEVKRLLEWLGLPAEVPIVYDLKKQGTSVNQRYEMLYRAGEFYE